MTVRELESRMTAAEFCEWVAFDQIHVSESWKQTDLMARMIVNYSGFARRAAEPGDYLPIRRRRTDEEIAARLRRAFGVG